MDNIIKDVDLTTGNGTDIIEILNIGFEPLLTKREYCIHSQIMKHKFKLANLTRQNEIINDFLIRADGSYKNWLNQFKHVNDLKIINCKNSIDVLKDKLIELFDNNINNTRVVYENRKFTNQDQCRKIAIFESSLTRMLGCKNFEFSDTHLCIVTYYTQILKGLMNNGFYYKNNKYVFFTAGAGATRQKKSTFIREDLLLKYRLKMFCGLTEERINELGGMNTNKYLAYTSLIQSNTKLWEGFDIKKAIVVNDIEFKIPNQTVRHIYTSTPEDIETVEKLSIELKELDILYQTAKLNKEKIPKSNRKERKPYIKEINTISDKRKKIKQGIKDIKDRYYSCEIKQMDVDIPFTDGFGISLKERGSYMIRLPFIKGLISYAPYSRFKRYCKDNKLKINKITDIYGKEYDIDKDGIEYIFTESQFKMHKYFTSQYDDDGNLIKTGWEQYQENFEKYQCEACICNVEENVRLNAKTNYQVLQTLTTEMTDSDIIDIAGQDLLDIKGIGNDIQSMLNILNANDLNNKKTPYQNALIKYPEMLRDSYVKEGLKNARDSLINKMKGGKFKINGAYTFIVPDVFACMQWWFLGERDLDKLGLIKDVSKVYCSLFTDGEELDCLRSPHLDHAHCIRNNMNKDECKDWFKTKGLYIGVKDIMCKFLMFDVDGDKSLVHNNKNIINCAKKFQEKYGMIPNFYDMAKAKPMFITKDNLFDGIVLAYHHGNIGTPSNEITKIFAKLNLNSTKEEIEEAINVVAFRCLDVNMTIDYSKTLWKMETTNQIKELYKQHGSKKVPRFFIYAKGKTIKQVEPKGKGNIDRIDDLILKNKIVFKDLLGKYTYKNLITEDVDTTSEKANEIISLYNLVDENNSDKKIANTVSELEDESKSEMLQEKLDIEKKRKMFITNVGCDEDYIVNVLVKYLKNETRKDTLWKLFGYKIYENICDNLEGTKQCEVCGKRFKCNSNSQKMCERCAYEKQLELAKKYKEKTR